MPPSSDQFEAKKRINDRTGTSCTRSMASISPTKGQQGSYSFITCVLSIYYAKLTLRLNFIKASTLEKGNKIVMCRNVSNFICFLFQSDTSVDSESVVDGSDTGETDLPVKVVEGPSLQSLGALPKIPLMDALQEAMQEININAISLLAPSASTTALSSLTGDDGTNSKIQGLSLRSAVEVLFFLFIFIRFSNDSLEIDQR